ncbi:synaptotagmin-like protein 4 [Clonorchis sinensis]|uniref:Synaptotagmin-like protein 4 n=1 Tax=Clonorchis sinensis TaxID=79923 RepID=G7Y864_CLOSI|nr:synaptotagmin-like protein 4 [Clonorchis sinensis]
MSVASDNASKTRNRYPSAGSQYASPARDYKSEAGYSNASKKSWTSSAARSSAYPRKGQTLGDIELTAEEQTHLESVLLRFDQFKQKEEGRIRSLRDELVEKQKVRIRNAEASGDGHCYNCGRLFMAVFNAPIECPICRHEFCRMCLEKTGKSKELICKFCRFESVSRGRLGVWFTEELKRARAAGRVRGVSGPEALRASLLRIKRESKASTLLRNLEGPLDTRVKQSVNTHYNEFQETDSSQSTEWSSPEQYYLDDSLIPLSSMCADEDGEHPAPGESLGDKFFQEPLEAFTAVTNRMLQKHRACDQPMTCSVMFFDEDNPPTPIRSAAKDRHTNENNAYIPRNIFISEGQDIRIRQADNTERTAEEGILFKRSYRRVRFFAPNTFPEAQNVYAQDRANFGSAGSIVDDVSNASTQPMTESWVQQIAAQRDKRKVDSGSSQENLRGKSKISSSEVSLPTSGHSALTGSSHLRPPPREHFSSSVSDLRHYDGSTIHKQRLQSETDSKSTLSLASRVEGMERTNREALLLAPTEILLSERGLRRRSRTLDEWEFKNNIHRLHPTVFGGSLRTLGRDEDVTQTPFSSNYGSTLSIYSERESSYTHGIAVTGDLRLDIQYDHQSSTLRIAVKQARDLAIADRKHMSCNPYVKSYLLPDKTKGSKRKTSHKRRNRNPVFEEVFKYSIPYSELLARTLQIAVWHKTSSGTNLFLGEVIIPFSDFQFEAGPQWYPLSERRTVNLPVTMQIDHGSLLLALKLIPGATSGNPCEIHVWIKSATGLTTSSSSSKSTTVNPYVKIYMLPDKAKNSKRKTKVLKKTNNPEWNTNFVYNDINRNQLSNIGIEVSVWDHGRVSSSDFLGGCRLNSGARTQPWMDATGTEQSIWLAMIQRPQTWLEGLIRLRSNLD